MEQFEALVELKKYDANGEIPLKSITPSVAELEGEAAAPEGHGAARGRAVVTAGATGAADSGARRCGEYPEYRGRHPEEARGSAQGGDVGAPQAQPEQPGLFALQRELADINETNATATHKRATAYKATVDAQLAPAQAAHDAMMERAHFHKSVMDSEMARLSRRCAGTAGCLGDQVSPTWPVSSQNENSVKRASEHGPHSCSAVAGQVTGEMKIWGP